MYIHGRVTLAKKHGKFDPSLGTVEDKDNTYINNRIINIQNIIQCVCWENSTLRLRLC